MTHGNTVSEPDRVERPRRSRWFYLASTMLAVYWTALAAGTHAPNPSMGDVQYNDKLLHFLAYAGLAFLLSWVWTTRRKLIPWGVCFALSVAACYGGFDELTQLLVPGRSGEVADWLADVLGALSGIAAFWSVEFIFGRLVRRGGSSAEPAQ